MMSDGLTYPGLRCILEYLEANKRIHITASSPVLQKFEKSVPLHLDYIYFSEKCTILNDIGYNIFKHGQVWDCVVKGEMKVPSRLPDETEVSNAIKVRNFRFLEGRGEVHVKSLKFRNGWSSFELPENVQFKIRKLDTDFDSFRDGYLSVVHLSSFPLVQLKATVKNIEDLNHEVLRSAAKLEFSFTYDPNYQDHGADDEEEADENGFLATIGKLPNSEIVLHAMLRADDETSCARIIRNYMRLHRSIGAYLTFASEHRAVFQLMFDAVKSKLKGTNVSIVKPVEGLTAHTPYAVPINSTSAALIYGVFNFEEIDLKIEIVPIDAFTPVDQN